MAKQSRWLADANDLRRRRKRQAAARRTSLHSAESLESRLALAIDTITNIGLPANAQQGLADNWVVIFADATDDMYVQRVATGEVLPGDPQDPTQFDEQDLLYANNSSFLNEGPGTFGVVPDIDLQDTIYVTNGTRVDVANVGHDQYPLTSLPVDQGVGPAPWFTTFVLSQAQIEQGEACSGVIAYAGNTWNFSNNVLAGSEIPDLYPSVVFEISDGAVAPGWPDAGYPAPGLGPFGGYVLPQFAGVPPALPIRPISIAFTQSAGDGDATVIVGWSGYPIQVPGDPPEPTLTITYDANPANRQVLNTIIGPAYGDRRQSFTTDAGLLPSAGPIATFTLPVTNVHPGGIVNGTLQGVLSVDGGPDFLFAPAQLFGPLENQLVFTPIPGGGAPSLTGAFIDSHGDDRFVTGSYDPLTGVVTFEFRRANGALQALNGPTTILSATYANYYQPNVPTSATFFAGLDIHNEIYVDLLSNGSTIDVESPIIHNTQDTAIGIGADIDLRATNVNVDATMSAFDSIRIGPSRARTLFPHTDVAPTFHDIVQAQAYAIVGAAGTPQAGQIVDIVVPINGGGRGYDEAILPVVVWIAPPPAGGTPAAATAIVENGVVVGFTIDDPGSGYSTAVGAPPPQVSISPPPAQPPAPATMQARPLDQALAFAVVGSTPGQPDYGQIIDVVVYPGREGLGYDPANPPNLTIAQPPAGGTQAVITVNVVGGQVAGFTIVNPGSGYLPSPTSPPQVAIDPPPRAANELPTSSGTAQGFAVMLPVPPGQDATFGILAIVVPPGLGGQGYDPSRPPTVFISPPAAGGVAATAEAVVENGVVVAINVLTNGSGYTDIPAVTIAPPPDLPPIGPGFIDVETDEFPNPRPSGYRPFAEQVFVNAAVAAQFYDIRLGEDVVTPLTRGKLFVSTSGSLSGAIPAVPGAVTTTAQRVFVQADNADILVEGQIFAGEHTYLMQSNLVEDADPNDGLEPEHSPFVFSTRSPATGGQTGLIRGGVLAVTLGNDTPSPEIGASALNTVDLQTRVDSIRVKAATRNSTPLEGPFPYDLTIRDIDAVIFDAVAASGRPITLSAGGDIGFNAALATGSDLRGVADGVFTVTAPISSTRGQIDITGTSVGINNSLRVLDPSIDPARDDITLRATAGDLTLVGLVSAVNNVNLIQRNTTGPRLYSASTPGGLAITDFNTVEQPLVITDDYVFNDVNVTVNLVHPFVGDLTIELVAPNGTAVTLFDRQGANGNNLTGTVFDSEAATAIAAGQAPFTGSFRPVQPLTPLYGLSTLGTWRLRIRDQNAQDEGSLLNFGLRFNIPGAQYGRVGGTNGTALTSRVVAERLNVEAEGSVAVATNVDILSGIAAVGFTVDEQDDIAITSLRSGGLVSLRAAGVDAGIDNPYTNNAIALTANLIDVSNLEASAPAGSIEIVTDTSKKLVLGQGKAIASGLAAPMQAAGNVVIRSRAGDIDVLDAPLGGVPLATVRVATTAALPAVYAHNVPGTRSSTLTATGPGSLNNLSLGGVAGIDAVNTLLVGDRVLVKNQPSVVQVVRGQPVEYYPNGIYVITSLGSGTTPWVLTRAGDADTSIELPAGTKCTVQDGGQASKVFSLATYADVLGSVPIGVSVVPNRPEAILVRAATTGSLWSTYSNAAGSITSVASGALPLVDGIALRVADRVLVRQGTHTLIDPRTALPLNTTHVSNGVYEVVDLGSPTTPWVLQRIAEMDGLVTVAPAVSATRTGASTVVVDPSVDPAVFAALQTGMFVRGTGVAPGALITAIDPITLTLTLTAGSVIGTGPTVIGVSRLETFQSIVPATRTAPSTVVVDAAADPTVFASLQVGMYVGGSGINSGAEIVAIDPVTRTLTLNENAVVGSGPVVIGVSKFQKFAAGATVTRTGPSTIVVGPSSDPANDPFVFLTKDMVVTGTGIAPNAVITAINPVTRTLTLTAGSVTGGGAAAVTFTGRVVNELLGYVNVREGTLSTPAVGGAYRVAFDSLGLSMLGVVDVTGQSVTQIGSDKLASLVRFVVSSNVGSNGGAGTLGKMIGLRQANAAARFVEGVRYGNQDMDFRFSTLVTAPIQLTQQLPAVTKPFLIDAGRRYTPEGTPATTTSRILLDGSRISRDESGRTLFQGTLSVTRASATTITLPASYTLFSSVREGMLVTGSAIRQGTRISAINRATRTLTLSNGSGQGPVIGTGVTSVTIATEISGLRFAAGSGAANVGVDADLDGNPDDANGDTIPDIEIRQPGAVLVNVNVGGFGNGAAVTIDGADGVVIRNSIIGQAVDGSRLSNRYGVLVRGATASATLLNNQIVGHSGAGIRIQDTAGRVTMVGNIIGTSLLPNEIGVEITSTATGGNANRVGVDPILPNRALAAVTVARVASTHTITLPASYAGLADLFVGLGVQGAGIAAGARIRAINTTTRVVSLTLDGSTAGGVASNGSGSVTFGNFVNTVKDGTTLVLPAGVNMRDLFLGQGVIGAGIRGGTTITAIDLDPAKRTITLSSPLLATAEGVAVTFTAPARNQIAFNRYGLWLAAGNNTVTNSDIFSNTFDGVRIAGGVQTIGTSTKASSKSNAIFSNGGWGVNIVAPAVAASQTVQGNYLGTRAPGSARLRNVLGNINPRLSPQWVPNPRTNVDPQGNVHGPAPSTGGSRPPSVPFPL